MQGESIYTIDSQFLRHRDLDPTVRPNLHPLLEKYPAKTALISQIVRDVPIKGSSSIDTGFVYTPRLFCWHLIPGYDNKELRVSMRDIFGVDWLSGENAEIQVKRGVPHGKYQ